MSEVYEQKSMFEHLDGLVPTARVDYGEQSVATPSVTQNMGQAVIKRHFGETLRHEADTLQVSGIDLSKNLNKIKELKNSKNKNNVALIADLEAQNRKIIDGSTVGEVTLADGVKLELFDAAFEKSGDHLSGESYIEARARIDSYNESSHLPSQANARRLGWHAHIATGVVQERYATMASSLQSTFDKYEIPESERNTLVGQVADHLIKHYSGDRERGAARRLERKRLEDSTGVTARQEAREKAKEDKRKEVWDIYD